MTPEQLIDKQPWLITALKTDRETLAKVLAENAVLHEECLYLCYENPSHAEADESLFFLRGQIERFS